MKTLEKKAEEYLMCNFDMNDIDLSDAFKEGVEFAQRFYLIERDQYAEICLNQKDEIIKNMPIIVMYLNEYGEESYDIFSEYTSMLEIPDYTHWRPINIK